jgi:hypothetical protein
MNKYPGFGPSEVKVIQPAKVRQEEAWIAFLEAATGFLRLLKRAVDYWIERKNQQ